MSIFTPETWGRYQQLTASEDESTQDLAHLWGRLADEGPLNGPMILSKSLVHIDGAGAATSIQLHKHELVRDLGIHYRDALMLDPQVPIPFPPAVLIREKAIIVNLEAVRMIICQNQCMVLSIPKDGNPSAAAPATVASPFIVSLCECLSVNHRRLSHQSGSSFDRDSPYELRALEVAIAAVTRALDLEAFALESAAYPVLEQMAKHVHLPVEALRDVKVRLNRLTGRLERVKQTLAAILGDDSDMADMYLARRADADGAAPPAQPAAVQAQAAERLRSISEGSEGKGAGPGTRPTSGSLTPDGGASCVGVTGTPPKFARRASLIIRTIRSRRGFSPSRPLSPTAQPHLRQQGSMDGGTAAAAPVAGGPSSTAAQSQQQPQQQQADADEEEVLFENPIGRMFVDPRDIEAAEDLLETGFIQVDHVLRRLHLLAERIESDELLFKLAIDGRRNELQALDLVATVITAAFGYVSMVASVFGMNLFNTPLLQDNRQFFVWTIVACVAGLVTIPSVAFTYVRRRRLTFVNYD